MTAASRRPLTHAALHCAILMHLVEHGNAPTIDGLSAHFGQSREHVVFALKALQDYHGVVLHPVSNEVWTIHPFATAPTNFWVQTPRGQWWGNCAWCSMGVIALVGNTGTVTTTLGAEVKQATVHIDDGVLREDGYFVHFPVPMKHAWDNVTYTCSNMLLFDSLAAVDDWCARHRMPRGDVQPLANVVAFARAWYGRHLDEQWTKWTADEARALFAQFALTGPTWEIPGVAERF
ncbi:MAG: hypothetical protein H7066_07075 [Cytophagaceae bacterium]|nr:hypothetical protein [Gemmatimonadaceae bacterium]